MKVAVFSTKPYDRSCFEAANVRHKHELVFYEPRLVPATTSLAYDFPAVCVFVEEQFCLVSGRVGHGCYLQTVNELHAKIPYPGR